MFTGCADGIIRCYNAKSGQLLEYFEGHEQAVTAVAIVGDKVYSASSDGTLRVWNAAGVIG